MARQKKEGQEKTPVMELAALTLAANQDPKKIPELRKFMAEHENMFEEASFLLTMPSKTLISKLSGKKAEGTRTLYIREVDKLKEKLTEPGDSPLAQLLIERIAACFLRICLAELLMSSNEVSYKQSEYLDRELTSAHNRFLRACDALARFRLMAQGARVIKAKADLIEAKASEAKIAKANGGMRLLKSATNK